MSPVQQAFFLIAGLIQSILFMLLWVQLEATLDHSRFKKLIMVVSLTFISITIIYFFITDSYSKLIAYALLLFFVKIIFQKSLLSIISSFFFIFIITYGLQSIQIVVFKLFFTDLALFNKIHFILISNLIFVFLVNICYKYQNVTNVFKKYCVALKNMPFIIMNLVLTLFFIQFFWERFPIFFWDYLYFIIGGLWSFFMITLIGLKKSTELIEKNIIVETYEQYYPIISKMVDEAKSAQHEFKNHLNTISSILSMNKEEAIDDVLNYINSVGYRSYDEQQLIQVENKIVAAIIYTKIIEAKEKNIDFVFSINNLAPLRMKAYELVEVIGNLLENAFEAVVIKSAEERKVQLIIEEENNCTVIQVRNKGITVDMNQIPRLFEQGFSSKGQGRGYGLFNVLHRVNEYSGKVSVYFDSGDTVFEITI